MIQWYECNLSFSYYFVCCTFILFLVINEVTGRIRSPELAMPRAQEPEARSQVSLLAQGWHPPSPTCSCLIQSPLAISLDKQHGLFQGVSFFFKFWTKVLFLFLVCFRCWGPGGGTSVQPTALSTTLWAAPATGRGPLGS